MKFYIVQRDLKFVGYDEFDSLVIHAHNKGEALKLAIAYSNNFSEKGVTVEAVQKTRKAQVVHASFNAG